MMSFVQTLHQRKEPSRIALALAFALAAACGKKASEPTKKPGAAPQANPSAAPAGPATAPELDFVFWDGGASGLTRVFFADGAWHQLASGAHWQGGTPEQYAAVRGEGTDVELASWEPQPDSSVEDNFYQITHRTLSGSQVAVDVVQTGIWSSRYPHVARLGGKTLISYTNPAARLDVARQSLFAGPVGSGKLEAAKLEGNCSFGFYASYIWPDAMTFLCLDRTMKTPTLLAWSLAADGTATVRTLPYDLQLVTIDPIYAVDSAGTYHIVHRSAKANGFGLSYAKVAPGGVAPAPVALFADAEARVLDVQIDSGGRPAALALYGVNEAAKLMLVRLGDTPATVTVDAYPDIGSAALLPASDGSLHAVYFRGHELRRARAGRDGGDSRDDRNRAPSEHAEPNGRATLLTKNSTF